MRLALDLQGAQEEFAAGASGGPIWRQALALAEAGAGHALFVVLSDAYPASIDTIRNALGCTLPQRNIHVWHTAGFAAGARPNDRWRRRAAALLRETLISALRPDLVFIPDFEGDNRDGRVSGCAEALLGRTVVGFQSWDRDRLLSTAASFVDSPDSPLTKGANAKGVLVFTPVEAADVTSPSGIQPEKVRAVSLWPEPTHEQSLSTARQVLRHLEDFAGSRSTPIATSPASRPRLAFVSPLPPERTGIADYSAELLRELVKHYDIDLVVSQAEISTEAGVSGFAVRSPEWFALNGGSYDRVLYHVGNSVYHQHMFDLVDKVPGVVVLHDFFLGDIQHFMEARMTPPAALARALYVSHGYRAVAERYLEPRITDVLRTFPANLGVLESARGVIVHSKHARQLARDWYGDHFPDEWAVVPLLRRINGESNRAAARNALGLADDEFLVCSFGLLGPTKLNHRVLDAWLSSGLVTDRRNILVFVGEEEPGEYAARLRRTLSTQAPLARVHFTGWTGMDVFQTYLAAADVAVQLRAQSRGETSAAALDCMSHGLPTIVNANGAFAELPSACVLQLPDHFSDAQLGRAILDLQGDREGRQTLGQRARDLLMDRHNPAACVPQYVDAIERFYAMAPRPSQARIGAIAEDAPHAETGWLAEGMARAWRPLRPQPQLFIDVSATCRSDLRTGVQRVVRALVRELIETPPSGYRVEPVFLSDEGGAFHYRHARQWTSRLLGIDSGWHGDKAIDIHAGDHLLMADLAMDWPVFAEEAQVYSRMRAMGVACHFFVYDLLPIRRPDFFPPGEFGFTRWLSTLSRVADGAICISQTTAIDLERWVEETAPVRDRPLRIDWFHLGADLEKSTPTVGLPKQFNDVLACLQARPTFLMVGTIEPRKGHLQVLEAFSLLWEQGAEVGLVVVGAEGWQGLPDKDRRTIPEILNRLRGHPEKNRRLVFLEHASDECLERLYREARSLLAASEGEGFGLPLIEAAHYGLPIFARDIPIFREVAGPGARYFDARTKEDLANAIAQELRRPSFGSRSNQGAPAWLTWKQSAAMLTEKLGLQRARR
jgi:glycosyltransferase involved in cell wall biosynthesis